jgi:2-methylcitrate dehydratase PrpD
LVIERRDEAEWPAAPDPVREAIGALLAAIMENTADGSRERKQAMTAAIEAHGRIVDAMRVRPTLQ